MTTTKDYSELESARSRRHRRPNAVAVDISVGDYWVISIFSRLTIG